MIKISPTDPIEEAAKIMRTRKIGSLVVMMDGEMVGLKCGSVATES